MVPAGKTVIHNFLGTGMISVMPVLLFYQYIHGYETDEVFLFLGVVLVHGGSLIVDFARYVILIGAAALTMSFLKAGGIGEDAKAIGPCSERSDAKQPEPRWFGL